MNGVVANGSSLPGGNTPVNGYAKYQTATGADVLPVEFPKSKVQLGQLLDRYYRILKSQHDLKLESDIKSTGYNASSMSPQPNLDAIKAERKAIEKVLYKVSKQQKQFELEQQEFLDEILTTSPEEVESFDKELFSNQLMGFQLLSRDLDLPESLQVLDDKEFKSNGDVHTDSIDEKAKKVIDNLSFTSADFQTKVESLGIISKLKTEDKTPSNLSAPLGNFFKEKLINNKIINRINQLQNIPANIASFEESDDELKLQALIELKSLRLLPKQRQLKHNILVNEASQAKFNHPNLKCHSLALQEKRTFNIRAKVEQRNPELLAIQLENLQKLEAGKLKHLQHVNKVNEILESSLRISNARYQRHQYRTNTLPRHVNLIHQTIEKDESKKLERSAKLRLQALKANDEEAYIKLLDQTKDHRITHLLKQTNQFLDTLAQQVKAQQAEHDLPVEQGEVAEAEDSVDELREKIDYYQVAHRIKEEITEQPNILVGGKLKEYQLKGLQWMVSLYNNKLNGILADEMGLGKTIQSISLITYLIEKKHEEKFIVIVPLSTITNWTLEFEKWAPSVKVIVYKGSQQQRRELQPDVRLGNFQVMLTTYEYIIRERPLLCKFNYSHMIIDEGHRMKNATSKLSITLKSYYRTKNRLILTGTPLQNNLPELWALLNFVLPKIFNSVKSFDEWFNTPFANTGSQEKIELTEEESLLVIRRLHKVLRPFLLRRLKKDVEKDLPDKVEKVIKCKLSGLQYVLYQQMLSHNALFVGAEVGGQKSGIKGLNNKIMQLRKICNHPFVFEEVETVLDSSRLTNDLIWRVSGKFELLDRVLPKFKATGHRVLIFFQMTQVMDIMEDFLRWRGMKYLRLDGSTKAEDRQDMLKVFNAPDSEYFCFLLSTRAGGLGLNLQTADTVIIFDTDWNPHQDLQAQDRAHRIGQKNEVRILRLITNDSVEEVILERAHQKLEIDGKVIQAGKFDNKSTAEEQEEFLKRLLEAESSRDDSEENEALDEDELNEILARSEEEKEIFDRMDDDRKINHDKNFKTRLIEKDELPPVFTEDISHHFEKDNKELAKMREKKKVKYDDGLTEEQWLMAVDNDDDTIEDAIRRKEQRMARRKRANDDDEETSDGESYGYSRKRRSRSKTQTPQLQYNEFNDKCQEVIDKVMGLVGDDGHSIAEIFLKLPSRKLYPDYYQIITNPTCINQIKKLIEQEKYDSFEAFLDDLQLMCNNAKLYNEESSWVYQDALAIEGVVEKFR